MTRHGPNSPWYPTGRYDFAKTPIKMEDRGLRSDKASIREHNGGHGRGVICKSLLSLGSLATIDINAPVSGIGSESRQPVIHRYSLNELPSTLSEQS